MNRDTVDRVRREVVGLRQNEALGRILAEGLLGQVISTDGIQIAVTAEHRPNRINLEVIDGVVRDATVG